MWPPARERASCWGSRTSLKAALLSRITREWSVRIRGFLTPTGLNVTLSTVLYKGTVVTVPQIRYHQGGNLPQRYIMQNSSSKAMVPSSHTSARLVRYSAWNPPVPGATPVGRCISVSLSRVSQPPALSLADLRLGRAGARFPLFTGWRVLSATLVRPNSRQDEFDADASPPM